MNLPRGELVRSRVVSHPAAMLETVLERELTGYAVFEPQDSLLLDAEGHGIITFEAGIPTLVYHTGTNRGGSVALADLAMPGPYSIDLFRVSADELASVEGGETGNNANDWKIPPGMPAKRLAGDSELADRTRERAPPERKCLTSDRETDDPPSAVEAFLENDEKIDAIREQAREEAQRRAEEWGLNDQLGS
ncbi:hypothetical protein SAMN05421858_0563 [Haladaptatus litoreus]|uniref:DUF8054 domain-containing protein n=1 Tax=Haladaptatus litoreus TaxID=553468 RepID=A0A1N6W1H0_9EURY|nr:hypothetical protein [Haladaptatus litoreus]SIQ83832.1 hypothetical protein SAMN05421858_0563 [Haladaptatus litoreus]